MSPDIIRVLVVHSEPVILRSITRAFEMKGYHVSFATNGLDGMFVGNDLKFDMILSAIDLPKISGFEMVRSLQSRYHNNSTPVFFIGTGEESADVVRHAASLHGKIMTLPDIMNGISNVGDTARVFK